MSHNQLHEQQPPEIMQEVLHAGNKQEFLVFDPAVFESSHVYEDCDMEANPVVAELDVADNHFVIMKDPKAETNDGRYFLASTIKNNFAKDSEGRTHYKIARTFDIEPGKPFDFGRTALKPGIEMKSTMSRHQAMILLYNEGQLAITQVSENVDTRVTLARTTGSPPAKRFWNIETDDTTEDTVPREKVQRALGSVSAAAAEQALSPIEQLQAQEKEIKARLQTINEPFDEDTRLNLWRYASGLINKRQAQLDGDGNMSTNYGQQAGQAYRDLPESAKQVADNYRHVMEQLDIVRDSINQLRRQA